MLIFCAVLACILNIIFAFEYWRSGSKLMSVAFMAVAALVALVLVADISRMF